VRLGIAPHHRERVIGAFVSNSEMRAAFDPLEFKRHHFESIEPRVGATLAG
jgi:hypothetical protein